MKKILIIFGVILTITSCRYSFEIEKIGLETELCVRSMVCADSTVNILLHKAVPITDIEKMDTSIISPILTLKCNGEEVETVMYIADNGGRKFTADAFTAGDKLEIVASAEGVETIMASTIVPDEFPPYEIDTIEILSYGYENEFNTVIHYQDNPDTQDYYGVCVELLMKFDDPSWPEALWQTVTVNPGSGYDEINIDPNIYSPTIGKIENKNVFIWKDIEADGKYEVRFKSSFTSPNIIETRARFYLYKLSEELYKTMKADFEASCNPLFYLGLATPSFTYSNINKGLGYFGAYSKTCYDYIIKTTSNE